LVQIKLTFTMSAFTKCFRPVSNYPTDYSGCVLWLKADSGVDFSIPTKKVTTWDDQGSSSNDFRQITTSVQPLRYGYDGANDKSYINFSDSSYMVSKDIAGLAGDFTIFAVGKITHLTSLQPLFTYLDNSEKIVVGYRNGDAYVELEDGDSHTYTNAMSATTDYNIIKVDLKGSTGKVNMQVNNNAVASSTISAWTDIDFNKTNYKVGVLNTSYLDNANLEEVIVYDRVLTDIEIADVRGYLNLKYKIY